MKTPLPITFSGLVCDYVDLGEEKYSFLEACYKTLTSIQILDDIADSKDDFEHGRKTIVTYNTNTKRALEKELFRNNKARVLMGEAIGNLNVAKKLFDYYRAKKAC